MNTSEQLESSIIFHSINSGSSKIHLGNSKSDQPVCGVKLPFVKYGFQIKFDDGDLKELWGDGKIQPIKWVTVDSYLYCKRCLTALKKPTF